MRQLRAYLRKHENGYEGVDIFLSLDDVRGLNESEGYALLGLSLATNLGFLGKPTMTLVSDALLDGVQSTYEGFFVEYLRNLFAPRLEEPVEIQFSGESNKLFVIDPSEETAREVETNKEGGKYKMKTTIDTTIPCFLDSLCSSCAHCDWVNKECYKDDCFDQGICERVAECSEYKPKDEDT